MSQVKVQGNASGTGYPDDYSKPEYTGEVIPAVWADVEDLSTIERFGFSKADFN